jgi:hypothetical protein
MTEFRGDCVKIDVHVGADMANERQRSALLAALNGEFGGCCTRASVGELSDFSAISRNVGMESRNQ